MADNNWPLSNAPVETSTPKKQKYKPGPTALRIQEMERKREQRRRSAEEFKMKRQQENRSNEDLGKPGDVDFQRMILQYRSESRMKARQVEHPLSFSTSINYRSISSFVHMLLWRVYLFCEASEQ